MPIAVRCACGKEYHFKDEYAGRRAKCPACGQVVRIPGTRPAGRPLPHSPLREDRRSRTRELALLGSAGFVVLVGIGLVVYFLWPSGPAPRAAKPAAPSPATQQPSVAASQGPVPASGPPAPAAGPVVAPGPAPAPVEPSAPSPATQQPSAAASQGPVPASGPPAPAAGPAAEPAAEPAAAPAGHTPEKAAKSPGIAGAPAVSIISARPAVEADGKDALCSLLIQNNGDVTGTKALLYTYYTPDAPESLKKIDESLLTEGDGFGSIQFGSISKDGKGLVVGKNVYDAAIPSRVVLSLPLNSQARGTIIVVAQIWRLVEGNWKPQTAVFEQKITVHAP